MSDHCKAMGRGAQAYRIDGPGIGARIQRQRQGHPEDMPALTGIHDRQFVV